MMIVKSQERRDEGQKWSSASRSKSGSRLSTLDSRSFRSGVTLVELLVTILIIGILAAMVLGIAAVAGNSAREAKTRNIIARLHTLLMEQADSYKTRRVIMRQLVSDAINTSSLTPAQRGMALTEARLYALREMMLMEMPDRWSDVWMAVITNASPGSPVYLDVPTSRFSGGIDADRTEYGSVYLRRYLRLRQQLGDAGLTGSQIDQKLLENQGAECLYLVITTACGDGEARSQFHESDIGDTDGDGAPEFLDGWGDPISFLRWAPGFDSPIQANANLLDNPVPPTTSAEAWREASNSDHDPYDMYRVDPGAYRLVPLIFSAGRDEQYGIFTDVDTYPAWRAAPAAINSTAPFFSPRMTYYIGTPDYLGTADYFVDPSIDTRYSIDNIHNHLILDRTK